MSDTPALAASRLPDLPHAGYSTAKQRELSDAIMFLIRGFERDRPLLLETVILGRDLWRKRMKQGFKAVGADDELADAVFGYFVLLAGPNPEYQREVLRGVAKQVAQSKWDYRQNTKRQFAKARHELHENIRRELMAPKKVYS